MRSHIRFAQGDLGFLQSPRREAEQAPFSFAHRYGEKDSDSKGLMNIDDRRRLLPSLLAVDIRAVFLQVCNRNNQNRKELKARRLLRQGLSCSQKREVVYAPH